MHDGDSYHIPNSNDTPYTVDPIDDSPNANNLLTTAHFDPSYAADDTLTTAANTVDITNIPHQKNNANHTSTQPEVGDKIEIYWPLDNAFYPGSVVGKQDNHKTVVYDDGGIEKLDFTNETWRFESTAVLSAYSSSSFKVQSVMQDVLNDMLNYFGDKLFLRHQAQAFPQFRLRSAYELEEADFKKMIKLHPIADLPNHANLISSHVIYKLKVNDDSSLKLKARIAPHRNEDSAKDLLRSKCSMCPPAGFRIVTSIASLTKWRLTKIVVKTTFLQSGRDEQNVFVIPPYKSADRSKFAWLLLTAAYGLVRANAELQNVSDQLLTDIGFSSVSMIPHLFMMTASSKLVLLVAEVVDDILICNPSNTVDAVINKINHHLTLGTIKH